MRIIAGQYKRRKLFFPKDMSIRPTMDRVKESLFNILGESVVDKEVLSLFTGAGSLGLEALSRGAAKVTFVDIQEKALNILRQNIEELGISESQVKIYQSDALKMIPQLHKEGVKFDLVFIDPPYFKGFIKNTLLKIEAFDILTRFSCLVFEHSKDEPVPESAFFSEITSRKFGQTRLTFLKKNTPEVLR